MLSFFAQPLPRLQLEVGPHGLPFLLGSIEYIPSDPDAVVAEVTVALDAALHPPPAGEALGAGWQEVLESFGQSAAITAHRSAHAPGPRLGHQPLPADP
jgi:hypothetical protein